MTKLTKIMGIVNVTPNSFSKDGLWNSKNSLEQVLQKVDEFIKAQANILDVGGESTGPDSSPISCEEELARVIPVIQAIRKRYNIPLSIDTTKARVAEEAVKAGATMINDVSGLLIDPHMVDVVVQYNVPVVLMHSPCHKDRVNHSNSGPSGYRKTIVSDVRRDLEERILFSLKRGVRRNQIILDPGIGFGKTAQENLELIKNLDQLKQFGYPILLGVSRKSFIGYTTGASVENRLPGSLAAAAIGVLKGADIVRVHDVVETVQAIQIVDALKT